MKAILLLFCLLSIAIAVDFYFINLIKINQSESGSSKAKILREMSKKNPIISLNATGYEFHNFLSKFILFLAILFSLHTALMILSFSLLPQIANIAKYVTAAKTYIENGALFPIAGDEENIKPVFFGFMVYTQESESIFKKMKFRTVPNLVYYKPQFASYNNDEQFLWSVSPTDGHVTSSKILEFLNKRSSRNIEYKEPIINILFVMTVFVLVGILGFSIYQKFKFVFLNCYVQFIGAMAIYVTCMSGVVFDIIHNVPFTGGIDEQGNVRWLQEHDSRGQYGMEGVLMSSTISLTGLFLLALLLLNKTSLISSGSSKYISIAIMGAIILLIKFCETIYKKKSWYSTDFYPPLHYIKGPLSNDQGNSL